MSNMTIRAEKIDANVNLASIDDDAKCVAISLSRNQRSILKIDELAPLKVDMPCGSHWELADSADLPDDDIPCTCGSEKHWFFRWQDKPVPDDMFVASEYP